LTREDATSTPARIGILVVVLAVAMTTAMFPGTLGAEEAAETTTDDGFDVPDGVSTVENCEFMQDWYDELLAKHEPGTAVPLEYEPSDEDLAELGLPPADELTEMEFDEPTMFYEDGSTETVSPELLAPREPADFELPVHHRDGHGGGGDDDGSSSDTVPDGPGVATVGGSTCLGIRPGGWIFNLEGGGISWCTLAHQYGSSQISTAGHCASTGDEITMIGFVGDNELAPVLLDFGETSQSTAGGVGDDWALIDVYDRYQDLMTPTMCDWGGPFLGTYENEGVLAAGEWGGQGPGVTVNPDPTLVEGIVHYGHGTGIGTSGTPRAGAGAVWGSDYFAFVGAIGPGDSGSGANTATTQAAGIITHIIVDPVMRDGVGIAAGTRATEVGTPTMGLPVGVPAPLKVPLDGPAAGPPDPGVDGLE
jgi:hypothetical protein